MIFRGDRPLVVRRTPASDATVISTLTGAITIRPFTRQQVASLEVSAMIANTTRWDAIVNNANPSSIRFVPLNCESSNDGRI